MKKIFQTIVVCSSIKTKTITKQKKWKKGKTLFTLFLKWQS